jgi:hypothetical protein
VKTLDLSMFNTVSLGKAQHAGIEIMLLTEKAARTKWCPSVRVQADNRHFNTNTDGFENSERMYHCIGRSCMAWREFRLSHTKGAMPAEADAHGYCGLAGRPELE